MWPLLKYFSGPTTTEMSTSGYDATQFIHVLQYIHLLPHKFYIHKVKQFGVMCKCSQMGGYAKSQTSTTRDQITSMACSK